MSPEVTYGQIFSMGFRSIRYLEAVIFDALKSRYMKFNLKT